MQGFICGPRLYRFDGWYFEYGSYTSPWPLRQDGELRATPPGRVFLAMIARFDALPEEERETYRAGGIGGCVELCDAAA